MTTEGQTRERTSRLSIRSLATLGALFIGGLAVLVAAALLWTTSFLEESIEAVSRDTQSRALASEIEVSVLSYQRLSNLHVVTAEDDVKDARNDLASRIEVLLARTAEYSAGIGEHQLIEQASDRVQAYFATRQQAEREHDHLREIVRATQPALNEAIASLESLRELNQRQVDEAQAAASRIADLAAMAGMIAGVSIILGMALVVIGVRRYLSRPILGLHQTMARYRSGDFSARAVNDGLREMTDLARGFNQMAESLATQRESQLTFLAGVAHDLRNPLHGLKLGLYALEREQSEGSRKRVAERLDRQLELLSRMVEDLLDATRIESGNLELREEEFDIREVVDDLINLHAPTSQEHQICSEQPREPVMVRADPLRMQQVLSNLLGNAIKYSPQGGQIAVRVQRMDGQVLLAVSDHGVGIPTDEIPNIFLPFCRRNSGIAPGAGLGLSVVRRIVSAHGANIEVESQPGVGSTFSVTIPSWRVCGADS